MKHINAQCAFPDIPQEGNSFILFGIQENVSEKKNDT